MNKKRGLSSLLLLLLLLLSLSGCHTAQSLLNNEVPVTATVEDGAGNVTEPIPEDTTLTLLSTGDILMHNNVISGGKLSDGTYNYDSFYAPVKHYIETADHASIVLECAMAGPDSGYTGYPTFNAPDALADALYNAGFDLINTAGNHCMDRGVKGGLRTLEVLRNAGLATIGTNAAAEELTQHPIYEINGIKLGYLAYSYGTNGIPVPEDSSWYFNQLDYDQIMTDISTLRPQVDVLVLLLHWGNEYATSPTAEQRQWAQDFFTAGADLILGSHPHVIQPAEIITVDGQDKLVAYSMANSIGSQNGLERNSGVLVQVEFTKNGVSGDIAMTDYSFTPTYIHSYNAEGRHLFRTVAVVDTITAIEAGTESVLGSKDLPTLQKILNDTTQTLSQLGLELSR